MKPELEDMPGLYYQLAEQLWINNNFWFAQMSIRGKSEDMVLKGMESNFAILYPYLTEKGKKGHLDYIAALKAEKE